MKNITGHLYRKPTIPERFKNAWSGWNKEIYTGRTKVEKAPEISVDNPSELVESPEPSQTPSSVMDCQGS